MTLLVSLNLSLKAPQPQGKHVVIAGGGPGGNLAAIYLARRGYQVSVYDKRALPDPALADPLRSYSLALMPRGLKPARDAGLDFSKFENPGYLGFVKHDLDDPKKSFFFPSGNGAPGHHMKVMLSRPALVRHMVEEAQRLFPENITFHFEHLISSLDFGCQTITFESKEENKEVTVKYDLLIGADGSNSRVREELVAAVPGFSYTRTENFVSFKIFASRIPTASDNVFSDPQRGPGTVMHGFTLPDCRKRDSMLSVITEPDGTCAGVLTLENKSLEKYSTREEYSSLVDQASLPEDFRTSILDQIVPASWSVGGSWVYCSQLHGPRTLLLGDAAHAVSPLLGLGANSSLEDSAVLDAVLERCKDDFDRAPAEFTRARLEDVHALVYFDQSLATKLRAQNLFLNKFFLMTECHKRFGPLLHRLLPFLYKSPENPVGGGPAATEEFTGAKLRAMRTTWSAVVFLVGAAALGGAVASGRSFLLKSR